MPTITKKRVEGAPEHRHQNLARLGLTPDRWDYLGSAICLCGVAVIMFAPRA